MSVINNQLKHFKINEFITILKKINGENLFNPYTDICPENDLPNANDIRTQNLIKYLTKTKNARILLIGEAPGYIGCRRTGLPFTDERHIKVANQAFEVTFEKATFQGRDKEISALHVWDVLKDVKEQPMVWNIIPIHPFKKGNSLSNRTPLGQDFDACKEAIDYLMKNRTFETIYAIGNKAYDKLNKLGYFPEKIRHPSMGGSNIFKKDLRNYLGLNSIIETKQNHKGLDDFF